MDTPALPLTPRLQQLFDFIKDFIETKGYSPTQPEIGAHFKLSKVVVHEYVHTIEKYGYLKIVGRKLIQIGNEIPLTETQFKVLQVLKVNPSPSAAAKVLGVAPASICEHINRLKAVGALAA